MTGRRRWSQRDRRAQPGGLSAPSRIRGRGTGWLDIVLQAPAERGSGGFSSCQSRREGECRPGRRMFVARCPAHCEGVQTAPANTVMKMKNRPLPRLLTLTPADYDGVPLPQNFELGEQIRCQKKELSKIKTSRRWGHKQQR